MLKLYLLSELSRDKQKEKIFETTTFKLKFILSVSYQENKPLNYIFFYKDWPLFLLKIILHKLKNI